MQHVGQKLYLKVQFCHFCMTRFAKIECAYKPPGGTGDYPIKINLSLMGEHVYYIYIYEKQPPLLPLTAVSPSPASHRVLPVL